MDVTEYLLGPILITGILSLIYLFLKSNSPEKKNGGPYSSPDWNFFLKKIYARHMIKKWKKSRLDEEIQLVPTTEEPLKVDFNDINDTKSFFGTNKDGYSILISFTRRCHRISDVILMLTLPDGSLYHLPNNDDIMIFDGSSETWQAGGLSLILLEPFVRWRIVFNGILQKFNDNSSDYKSHDLVHVRLNFIWIAASDVVRTPDDSSANLMAEAVATEPWKDPHWLDGIRESTKRGYDQYGSMCGTITIENQEQLKTSMYGLRQRVWQPEVTSLRRSMTISGSGSEGTVYQVGAESFSGGLSKLNFGNIRFPDGKVEVIEKCDIDLSKIGEYDSNIPKSFTIKLSTKSKDFTLFISLKKYLKQTFKSRMWKNVVIPFQAGINGCQGSGLLQLWYPYKGKMLFEEHLNVKQLKWLKFGEIKCDIPLCATFKERVSSCPEVVGGKGASLALLSSMSTDEYEVPKGFCLTRKALECQLKHHSHLHEAVQGIYDVNSNYNETALREACESATKLFKSTPLCDLVKEHIETSFDDLCESESDAFVSKDLFFAVRSSGIGEDSEELSAAGQNATILGCKTIEDIFSGIQNCWSSLFSFQSVEYRRQHGQPVHCGMGVVIQVMVDAKAAGVMFTRHPNTGNPSNIFITSNYGLGETVVSGQVEPDTIIVERDIYDNLKIKSVEIGKKGQRIVLNKSGKSGTQTEQPEKSETTASLLEEECLMLGRIAILQEKLWGLPRDIEWAIAQDRIYLVQARPITNLNSWTEFELAHELDSPVMSEEDLMTFANTGEVFPGSCTPLSHSVVVKNIDRGIGLAAGITESDYYLNVISCTHHHMGLNVFNTFLKDCEKDISIRSKIMDLAVFGHVVIDKKMHSAGVQRNGIMSFTRRCLMILKMGYFLITSKSYSERAASLVDKLNINLDKWSTCEEMLKDIHLQTKILLPCCEYHSNTTSASVFSQIVFLTIILESQKDFTTENYKDIGTILSSCADVISAQIPEELKKISLAIQSSEKADEFSNKKPENAIKWLEYNCPDAHSLLHKFLNQHGHRCIKEFDFATDTWGMDSTSLIKTLQATVTNPIKDYKNDPMTTDQLINQLVSPMRNMTKKILKYIIPMCQKAVGNREATKASAISLVHKLRTAYRELGSRMKKEWKLPDEKLIFFMTYHELNNYLKSRNPGYLTKAVLRRRFFSQWDKLQFPELVWGFAKPLTPLDTKLIKDSNSNFKITGTPVCSGDIVARACVIKTISEINQLQPGDILVTHSTDIGWSPYFPLIGGVVTELGGLISHGAVVAREYGLPCIVGAQGATSIFQTGDTVHLSASSGVLEKVEISAEKDPAQ